MAEIEMKNLDGYREEFIRKGVILPLKQVQYFKGGLLVELPLIATNKKGWPWDIQSEVSLYGKINSWPKISIIIPSYNQGEYIEEAIRSVILQNYPNLELIIIDGGSSDKTLEVLEKYSTWISFWQSNKDKGQGNAINLGFSIASGDYFGWLNSDYFYNRDAFFHLANEIRISKKEFYY